MSILWFREGDCLAYYLYCDKCRKREHVSLGPDVHKQIKDLGYKKRAGMKHLCKACYEQEKAKRPKQQILPMLGGFCK